VKIVEIERPKQDTQTRLLSDLLLIDINLDIIQVCYMCFNKINTYGRRGAMKKYTIAVIIAFVSALSIGQYAAAEVSKDELKSISTPDSVNTSLGEVGSWYYMLRQHQGK
jgi:hypothetical protein